MRTTISYRLLEAVHVAQPGDVVVISNSDPDVGMMGDLVGTEAMRKGLGGFVVEGSIRDRAELARMGLPVACRSTFPVGPLKIPVGGRGIGRVNVTLDVGGAAVEPGMWAFADLDGVVFIAGDDVARVFTQAADSFEREEALAAEIRGGTSLAEAVELEAFLRKRAEDPTASLGDHLASIGRAI
jgi:4-hydroxy-4-methyl-2-oxoglutarate aldolase